MKAKSIKTLPQFILTHEEKVALVEAKIARTEAHIRSLAALVEKQKVARGSKYSSR